MSRLEGFVRDGASQHMWMVASRIHECLTYITVEGVMSHIEAVVSQNEGVIRHISRMKESCHISKESCDAGYVDGSAGRISVCRIRYPHTIYIC